jgi:hypothetical protein
MPFPSPLSAGQLTQVRQNRQYFSQFMLLCPNDVVWQTQPAAAVDGSTPYLDFDWDGTDQGDRADVKQGMTVLISTTSDYKATAIFRGRVRKVPDATTFYINENSTNLADTYYVTVLDDYDIHERLERRTVAGVEYKDGDLPFEPLPPTFSGLQSVYVDYSGDDPVEFSFAPTVTANASGASISTYLWDVADGSITVGTVNDKDITVEFPGAVTNKHRNIILTATDDNGTSNYFVIKIYTINIHASDPGVVALQTEALNISATVGEGFNATVRGWDGISTVLDRTHVTVLSIDNYGGTTTPITQNVAFVGRLRTEGNQTQGDPRHAVLQNTTFNIEGFGTQLGRLVAPGLNLMDTAAPSEWGEVKDLTIHRAILYLLAWHSTFLTLSSITFDTDSEDYQWDDYTVYENSILEWVNSVADDYNAYLTFAASGESTVQRHASIAGTGGLDTILVFNNGTVHDTLDFSLDLDYVETHAQAIAGAATYNTTTGTTTAYRGRAPSQAYSPGWETGELNQQIMKADLTDAEARTETGSRVAAYLAYLNPKARLQVTLRGGFYWLVPSVNQLYAFTIAAADNTRGRTYTSSNKWLCIEVNYTFNNETGIYDLTGTFEIVTSGGNGGILVTQIVDVNDLDIPDLPPIGAGLGPIDPLINSPIDDPDWELPGGGGGLIQPGGEDMPVFNCEMLNVSMRTGSVKATTNNTVFGENYLITVEGDGNIDTADWHLVRLGGSGNANLVGITSDPCGYGVAVDTSGTTYDAGNDRYVGGNATIGSYKIGIVQYAPGASFDLTEVSMSYALHFTVASPRAQYVTDETGCVTLLVQPLVTTDETNTITATGLTVTTSDVRFRVSSASNTGTAYLTGIHLKGTGTAPPGAVAAGVRGDAFYYGYDEGTGTASLYTGSNGFRIDAAKPASIPVYNSSHKYQFIAVGTGAPFGFDYVDTNYGDNQNRNLVVTVCGPGMGMT